MSLPAYADGSVPGYYGVYPALVTDIIDPDSLGRVQVRFPWLGETGDSDVRAWATLCSPYADDSQGLLVLPEVGSQVVVAFEAGNVRRPYVLGSSWNGQVQLPHSPESSNNIRIFRSRADSRLEFDDTQSGEKISITMAGGHKVVLDNGGRTITITHSGGCSIKLTDTNIEVQANAQVKVTAPMVKVDAAMSKFSGVVKCDVLISNSVVSSSYTPGAGNIW
jgi:uncharacterized protein involved in type VI secretion and phage assembly